MRIKATGSLTVNQACRVMYVAAVPKRRREVWTAGPIPRNTAVQGMVYMRHGLHASKHSLSVKGPDCSYGLSHGPLKCVTC